MTESGSATSPIAANERITNLDTVRGIATLGILVMNAVSYGLADAAYFNLDAAGSNTWLDRAIGLAGEILVDQKTMALFSLLFGAGIVMFADRAAAKGRHPTLLSLWRNLLLLGIGALHAMIWAGDILMVYALCSPVLLLLRKQSPRLLLGLGATMVLSSAVWAAVAQGTVPSNGEGLGEYWFVWGDEMSDAVGLFLISDFFLRALGMMLIGVALYRFGIVQGSRPPEFYRRMAMIGFGIGFPLAIWGTAWQAGSSYSPDTALIGAAPNTLATIPIALGYLAMITLWNQRTESARHDRVRAVGRMALTNYLTQTVLGVVVLQRIIDQDGLTRTGIAVFVFSVWALQLVWSKWWLDHFRFGPIEWAWRCATYRRWQPIRRPLAA